MSKTSTHRASQVATVLVAAALLAAMLLEGGSQEERTTLLSVPLILGGTIALGLVLMPTSELGALLRAAFWLGPTGPDPHRAK